MCQFRSKSDSLPIAYARIPYYNIQSIKATTVYAYTRQLSDNLESNVLNGKNLIHHLIAFPLHIRTLPHTHVHTHVHTYRLQVV